MTIPEYKIHQGDCLEIMAGMPEKSVQCCVTSPPYWGLRDYGVDGQLGLEKTPEEYTEKMVKIFREVKRVLKDDGTIWLNLGDSYATHAGCKNSNHSHNFRTADVAKKEGIYMPRPYGRSIGLKEKDLIGIPWRVAFALQADGWFLRQDIIWHKPNPMPESVTDRCTKAHEYIFLLSKNAKYYCNMEAIKEPVAEISIKRSKYKWNCDRPSTKNASLGGIGIHVEEMGKRFVDPTGRNKRSVWTVTSKPYREAHFATYPPDLIKPCILAGCPEGGLVLDPFTGSGTTGEVCMKANRNFVGIELNPEYIEIATKRIEKAQAKWQKRLL